VKFTFAWQFGETEVTMMLNYTTPYYFSFALGQDMAKATDMWVF
jgi:hypothetical protein